jgi:hypothetical protein
MLTAPACEERAVTYDIAKGHPRKLCSRDFVAAKTDPVGAALPGSAGVISISTEEAGVESRTQERCLRDGS